MESAPSGLNIGAIPMADTGTTTVPFKRKDWNMREMYNWRVIFRNHSCSEWVDITAISEAVAINKARRKLHNTALRNTDKAPKVWQVFKHD